ncbi:MAG: hypothetical protein FWD48_05920 [Oscillospiraceae bacterium]|nr:hypothetical protein [Oscillospiraceae bacterium]
MKKLSILLSIILCFTACDNNSLILYESPRAHEEPVEENKTQEEPETQADIWTPFTEDSEGRMVFTDSYFFEPLELLGYIITEAGDVFIPYEDWEECDPDFFAAHVFGAWSFMGNTVIINESYITEKSYRNGDIIIFIVHEEDFSNMWIEWLDINNPDIMYGGISIRDVVDNGWDINVNVYREYIASPMISSSYRKILSAPEESLVFKYDDFIITLPAGWREGETETFPIYISPNGKAQIHVTPVYCIAGSYDECENASEALDVLMYLTGIDFDSERYSLIEKASYLGTDYDVHRIIYHDNNQWSSLWNDMFIISDGERHFNISLNASSDEDYYEYLADVEFVVGGFLIKQ